MPAEVLYPELSILLATYNGEKYIEAQLDSIISQTYRDFLLYISDDHSSDDTWEILQRYAARYPFIRLSRNQQRIGLVRNFEKLLTLCKSRYIAFCDQDDLWAQQKIEKSLDALGQEENDRPLLCHSDLRVADEDLNVLFDSFFAMRSYQFQERRQIDTMLGRCGVMGNTMMINAHLKALVLPFPDGLAVHDYWIALVNELFGKRITLLEPLVTYRIHDMNRSNSREAVMQRGLRIRDLLPANYRLPFHHISRENVLRELMRRFVLQESDRQIFERFLSYLELSDNRLKLSWMLLRYDFCVRVGAIA